MNIGVRLKEERKRLKISQDNLSIHVNLSKVSLSQYENEKTRCSGEFLEKIALLGFDVQYILTGIRSNAIFPKDEEELLMLYRSADNNLKIAAKAVLATGLQNNNTININADNAKRGSIHQGTK